MTAPVNPEGQTAREVRRAADYLESIAKWLPGHEQEARAEIEAELRALASTPSPAKQTEQDERCDEPVCCGRPGEECCGMPERCGNQMPCDAHPTAKQTEQKIASAEGAASQLGAAPATDAARDALLVAADLAASVARTLSVNAHATDRIAGCIRQLAAAPAQPDARDAEIARLTCVNDGLRNAVAEEQECHDAAHHGAAIALERAEAAEADASRLTKELEEARAALQATNKHAATVAHERDYLMQVDLFAATERADAAEAEAKALRARLDFIEHTQNSPPHRIDGCPICSAGEPPLSALAPPEPKAETEPLVFCGAVEPGHDGEHRRTPRCWYPHKAGEASPADWVNIPRAAPPPAETAGQKEGL